MRVMQSSSHPVVSQCVLVLGRISYLSALLNCLTFFLEKKDFVAIFVDNKIFVRHKAPSAIINFLRKDVVKMVCTSAKEGSDCFFMSKKGCEFNGGICHAIVEQCGDCQKVQEFPTGKYCSVFPDPTAKWRVRNCNMATHLKGTSKKEKGKVNPLKASKRTAH